MAASAAMARIERLGGSIDERALYGATENPGYAKWEAQMQQALAQAKARNAQILSSFEVAYDMDCKPWGVPQVPSHLQLRSAAGGGEAAMPAAVAAATFDYLVDPRTGQAVHGASEDEQWQAERYLPPPPKRSVLAVTPLPSAGPSQPLDALQERSRLLAAQLAAQQESASASGLAAEVDAAAAEEEAEAEAKAAAALAGKLVRPPRPLRMQQQEQEQERARGQRQRQGMKAEAGADPEVRRASNPPHVFRMAAECMVESVRGLHYDLRHWQLLPTAEQGLLPSLHFVCTRDERGPFLLAWAGMLALLIWILALRCAK